MDKVKISKTLCKWKPKEKRFSGDNKLVDANINKMLENCDLPTGYFILYLFYNFF
jgi:hypothetical protein